MLAVIAGLGFGLFFVALSRTSPDAGLFPLVGARVASIVLLGTILTARRSWAPLASGSWPIVIVAGVLDCARNAFYITALGNGTFTWIAAITSLYPVATVLLARVILRERLAPIEVAGLLLAGSALTLIAIRSVNTHARGTPRAADGGTSQPPRISGSLSRRARVVRPKRLSCAAPAPTSLV